MQTINLRNFGFSIMLAMREYDPRPMKSYDACYGADFNAYGHVDVSAASDDDAFAIASWIRTMDDCPMSHGDDRHSERLIYLEDSDGEEIGCDVDLNPEYSPWTRAARFQQALRDINAALVANGNSDPDAMADCLEEVTVIVHKALHQ